MSFLLSLGVAAMTQSAAAAATAPDASPIVSEETGVAVSYDATKTISCGDVEWRTDWKSRPDKGPIRGNITVLVAGKSKALTEAQPEVFGKFATIDSLSATCNKGSEGKPTRSTLLVLGHGVDNGKKSLAQLHVDPDMNIDWSFDPAE